jgi:hypothetical protein
MADVGVLRAEPRVSGLVESDPTISRTIDRLSADATVVLAAIDRTPAEQHRRRTWTAAGCWSMVSALLGANPSFMCVRFRPRDAGNAARMKALIRGSDALLGTHTGGRRRR